MIAGSDVRPELNNPSELLAGQVAAMARLDQSATMTGIAPTYHEAVKLDVRMNRGRPLWYVSNMVSVLSALQNYLEENPTHQAVEVTVLSNLNGRRAKVTVKKTAGQRYQFRYAAGGVVGPRSDIASIFLYTDDVIDTTQAESVLSQASAWSSRFQSQAFLARGFEKIFDGDGIMFRIRTLPTTSQSAEFTYQQLAQAMRAAHSLLEMKTPGRYVTYQARITDADGKIRGEIALGPTAGYLETSSTIDTDREITSA